MIDFDKHAATRVALFEEDCARLKGSRRGKADVVLLGDSLAERYKGPLSWVNRGICSDHLQWPSFNIFQRLGTDRLHPNPQAIVILVGINDLNDAPHDLDRHADAYRRLLGDLSQHYPAARLVVCSLLPTSGPAAHLNQPVAQFNLRLSEIAGLAGAGFLDLHACLFDASTGMARRAMLVPDGVHVSRRGYAELTACVVQHAPALGLAPGLVGGAAGPLSRFLRAGLIASAWQSIRGWR
ncbi:MAG: GDSL-type esterase/lipase family protein [Acidobacteriota bacterium]